MLRKIILTLFILAAVPALASPDLGITSIERTPRYRRYLVTEARGLPQQLAPNTENDQHWPLPGETVTYIAHVRNHGDTLSGSFAYRWRVDGAIVASGSIAGPFPTHTEKTVSMQRVFVASAQQVEFEADPANAIAEESERNNLLSIGTYDLTLSFFVERGIYELFENGDAGPFEDWLHAHIQQLNDRLGQAVYPAAPAGVLDRVRIDKLIVADDVDGAISPYALDPDALVIDGRWPVSDGDPTNAAGAGGVWQNFYDAVAHTTDWGLIHELAHQIGVIDLYRMNVLPNDAAHPNGGVTVRDASGRIVDSSRLPFPVFPNGGLMGGGDRWPYPDGTYFESHTAGGLNAHARMRRGHFGEYLFDVPESNYLLVLDTAGNPIPGARVSLFQKDYHTEQIDDAAEILSETDSSGYVELPNRKMLAITTVTGHELTANPFGQIHPSGQNGLMLVHVNTGAEEGFAFLPLAKVNVAYWNGDVSGAVHEVRVQLTPVAAPPADPAPSLNGIGRQVVREGETLQFTISGSDPLGQAVTFSASGLPAGATFVNRVFTWTPSLDQAGFHSVTFAITDSANQTDSEIVHIAVINTNQAPVARPGVDQLAGTSSSVILDGNLSTDADGDTLTYTWTQTAGPAVSFFNPNVAALSFVAPSSATQLTFALTVSDGTLTSTPASVNVTVSATLTASGNAQANGIHGGVQWKQPCSGANRILLVVTGEWRADANSQVLTIAANGTALTRLGQSWHPGTGALATMWALVAPPGGLVSMTATLGSSFASFGSSCWYGVAQTLPPFVTSNGNSSTPSLTFPSGTILVDGVATFGENAPGVVTPSAPQVLLAHPTGHQSRVGHSARTAGTSTSWSISAGDARWAMAGVVLQP